MKHLFLSLFLFALWAGFSFAQVNPYGQPFITNYSIKEYNANSQNWAVAQDNNGLMYFANNNGVLQYDGQVWELLKINKGAIVRSLIVDTANTLFVGAENEFGFIKANCYGKLHYTSLSDSLNPDDKVFSNINKIYLTSNGVLFCSNKKIFRYLNGKLQTINLSNGGFLSLMANDTLYMGDYWEGLMFLVNNTFNRCKGGEFYIEKDVFCVMPYENNRLLIATSNHGVFIYNPQNGQSEHPNYAQYAMLHKYISDNFLLYGGSNYRSGYRFNTLYGGSVVTDSTFTMNEIYSKATGLQDDVMLSDFLKDDTSVSAPLWFSLNNGISRVESNAPFRFFNESSGLGDEILDIVQYKNTMHFATINGVYQLVYKNNQPQFQKLENTEGECWSMIEYQNKLIIGGGYSFFIYSNGNTRKFESDDMIFKLLASKAFPDRIYIGEGKGISIFKLTNGQFLRDCKIGNISDRISNITEDQIGNLWLTTGTNELIKVAFAANDTVVSYFKDSLGFTESESLFTFIYGNKVDFSFSNRLMQLNSELNILEPAFGIDSTFLNETIHIIRKSEDPSENLWVLSVKEGCNAFYMLKKDSAGSYTKISKVFNRLPKCMINAIYSDKDGIVWMGTSEGLFTFNNNLLYNFGDAYKTLIRKVNIGEDSILYYGNSPNPNKLMAPLLNYANNGITFHYAASFFIEEHETTYSYFLQGFDVESSGWSNWNKETKKEYTNLPEGAYTFRVKAKNIYGIEGSIASFSFTIAPPWYRTIIAYIIYLILLSFFIWAIVKLNVRRLEYEKLRLEGIVKERTAEIREKKEEIEKQKEEITDSIKYAKRIQTAVLPPDEIIAAYLPEHIVLFKPRDIVSGDFYWMKQMGDYTLIAAADCTGHGVPGAFMSMLGIAFLNEIVRRDNELNASQILDELRNHVKTSLRQTGKEGEAKDGMDIAFCVINRKKMQLQYAGAYNPLYLYRKNTEPAIEPFDDLKMVINSECTLYEIKADKMPIGIHLDEKERFTNHVIDLYKGDTFYMFSDGYVDQIGGALNRKFMSKHFKNKLFEIQNFGMAQQKTMLNETIENWKGQQEQVDDIVLIGVRV